MPATRGDTVIRVCSQLLSLSATDRTRVLADIKRKNPPLYRQIKQRLKSVRTPAK